MGLFSRRNKKIRTTYEAETLRKLFQEDHELYTRVENSEELRRWRELDKLVNDPVFKARRKEVEQLRYKGSPYYFREKEYKKLLGNRKLKAYYQVKESQELQGYLHVRESDLYEEYRKLKVVVKAPGFEKKLRPQEYAEYRKLSADPKIKALNLFERNRKYRYYQEIRETILPEEFEKLVPYIKSDEFRENRSFLVNKKRYQTTEDYKLLCEYDALGKRPEIGRYFLLDRDVHFHNMARWEPVFVDEFDRGRLDGNRWIARYHAGERFLNDTYGVGDDVQLFTGDNISFTEKSVILNFKKEQIIGKYWDAKRGLREKEYRYTSGLLSTATSFRQQYGRFEAKIRITSSAVRQNFWMQGEEQMPHIQIVDAGTGGLRMGHSFSRRGGVGSTVASLADLKLPNDFYIFTLEWTPDKLTWRINDTIVKEVKEDVPNIPMYVLFSLGSVEEPAAKYVPSRMEIAWARFYKLKAGEAGVKRK
ncbi:MAG: glycoside hydrolase family 16 protein [Culturomica sp.]|jgi:hypothetical protein|nr:glycoside hydrolase family 16 protein [Culturomica sp.]